MGNRKHITNCVRICREGGLTVLETVRNRKHLVIQCSESPVVFPHTPSDYRWEMRARSVVRRIAGKSHGLTLSSQAF